MEIEVYELIYKNEKDNEDIRLLGKDFYKRNKSYGYIIYKNKKFKLQEKINTKLIK